MAVPAVAGAQGPIETTDDPLYNETTAPVFDNTVFHTDGGADYKSDGGTGADSDSDYHSDDNAQTLSVEETVVMDGSLTYEATYNQISDTSVNDLTASNGSGDSGAVNYTRDRENNTVTATTTTGGQTTTVSSPNVIVPTGYQIYGSVFG